MKLFNKSPKEFLIETVQITVIGIVLLYISAAVLVVIYNLATSF